MHITTKQQLQELQTLIDAHNVGGQLTLILTEEAKQTQGAYHTKITAKRKHQTRMATHDVALLEAIPGNKGPWTLPPVKTQTHVKPVDRVTIRITAASHFRAHLDINTTTPNKILADLAQTVPGLKVSQISGGQWWSEDLKGKQFLHTTVKVPTSIADTIIRYSGTRGIFTCKLGLTHTTRRINWFAREPNETNEAYLRRILAKAHNCNEGLKIRKGGPDDLGLFCTDEEMQQHTASHWISTGYPKGWEEDEILTFLEEQKWTNANIISRRGTKHKGPPTWWFKAIPPQDSKSTQTSWEFLLPSEDRIFIHKAPPKTSAQRITLVPGPRKQWNTGNSTTPKSNPSQWQKQRNKRAWETEIEIMSDEEPGETQIDSPSQHVVNTPPPARNPYQDEIEQLVASGWTRKECGGQGECGYLVIAQGRNHNQNQDFLPQDQASREAANIRAKVFNHIQKPANINRYKEFFAKDTSTPNGENTWDEWLRKASKKGSWIDGLQLQSASEKLGQPFIIWSLDVASDNTQTWQRYLYAPRISHGVACHATGTCPIVMVLQSGHYTLLVPPANTDYPSNWLLETNTPTIRHLEGAGPRTIKHRIKAASASTSSASPSIHTWKTSHGKSNGEDAPSLHTCHLTNGEQTPSAHTMQLTHTPLRQSTRSNKSRKQHNAGQTQPTSCSSPQPGQQHTPRSCSLATFFTRKPQAASNKQAVTASSVKSASCRGSHVRVTSGVTPRSATSHTNTQDAAAAARSNIDSKPHSTQDATESSQLSHTSSSHNTLTASNLDILNTQPPNSHKAAPSYTDPATRKHEWGRKIMHKHLWTCPICQENIEVHGHNSGQYYRKKHLELIHNESLANYPLPGRQNNTHRAMLRAKQLPNVGSKHNVVSINGKGIQDVISKTTWVCRLCLAKGTTAKIATSACNTTRIPFLRLKWWSQLDSAQKQKLADNLSLRAATLSSRISMKKLPKH